MATETPMKIFLQTLENLCNLSYKLAKENADKGYQNGLACQYFGRCTSCFVGIKTLGHALELSSTKEEYTKDYIDNILPASFPKRNVDIALKYIKETHMVNRFALFQNFYSQTEFTYRIIQREKHTSDTKTNPFRLMTDKYGIMSVDFVKFINAIRNTIHNNGFYFPSDCNPTIEYEFQGKKFKFIYGEPIEIELQDIFNIIEYVVNENGKLFQNNELSKIEFKHP